MEFDGILKFVNDFDVPAELAGESAATTSDEATFAFGSFPLDFFPFFTSDSSYQRKIKWFEQKNVT